MRERIHAMVDKLLTVLARMPNNSPEMIEFIRQLQDPSLTELEKLEIVDRAQEAILEEMRRAIGEFGPCTCDNCRNSLN